MRKQQLKYCCYQRTKKTETCNGQTVYIVSKVDKAVTDVLHQLFSKIKRVPVESALKAKQDSQNRQLTARQKTLKSELAKENSSLVALEGEILKVIQGESNLDRDILTKMISERKLKISDLESELRKTTQMLEDENDSAKDLSDEYKRISNWAQVFNKSSMPAKKMIVAHLINKVTISRGYEIEVELNVSLEQFNLGLTSTKVEVAVSQ